MNIEEKKAMREWGEGPAKLLSNRVKNALHNGNILLTRAAIAAKSRDELMRIPNLGKAGVAEIFEVLCLTEGDSTFGYRLRKVASELMALAAEIERNK